MVMRSFAERPEDIRARGTVPPGLPNRAYPSPMTEPHAENPSQPDEPRAVLTAEADRLREVLETGIVAPGPMTYGSQAAAASQVFEQQRDLALRERNEQHLAQVVAALGRIDDGSFGACIRCGKAIAPERLDAIPWAAHCIDCQRIVGRGG
jgi:RNA polymerase-binding transcription factor DksA